MSKVKRRKVTKEGGGHILKGFIGQAFVAVLRVTWLCLQFIRAMLVTVRLHYNWQQQKMGPVKQKMGPVTK